jgi:hypothetical protein
MKKFQNKYCYLLIIFAIITILLDSCSLKEAKSSQDSRKDEFSPPGASGGFLYEAQGRRDPFFVLVTPDGRIIEPPESKERTEGLPRLEGLMYDAKGISYAVMDGEVFRAGDMAGDYQIIRIDSNKVIMQKADRVFEVELKKED